MDVGLTEDQIALQETTRRFLEEQSPIGALRRLADKDESFDPAVWRQGAELGWVGLFVPEDHGGFSEGFQGVVDAAIVAEDLGRVVFSGPFHAVATVAFAVAQAGSDAQKAALLPALVSGDAIAAWCLSGTGAQSGVEPGGLAVTTRGNDHVIDGIAGYVQDAAIAQHLLVTARSDAGLSQFLIPADTPGVTILPLELVDLGRRLAHVRFEDVVIGAEALVGEAGAAAAQVERQLQVAVALQCAETVGVVDRALEFTLDYVKQRYAFGRPIGGFQALKHRLADHVTQLEGAKAAAAYAAKAIQNESPDAAIAVSVAKSQCGKWGTEIVRDCLHMHGGIGMTWEHDIHFYLRRAVSNEALWGTPAAHHERLCALAGL